MKGYIILLNGNITFLCLIWLVLIFCSFDAIKEGEKTRSLPECQNVFDTAGTLGRTGHLRLISPFLTKIIRF